jgi:hypothetical protein
VVGCKRCIPLKPATLLVVLSTSVLLGTAVPAQAEPWLGECSPGDPSQVEADLGLAEFTTVCTVEQLLELLQSVDCTAPADLVGQCVFCPPEGEMSTAPVGKTERGVFIAYFPAGFGDGAGLRYHVVFVPTRPNACEVET